MRYDVSTQDAIELLRSYDDRPDGKLDLGEFSKLVADLNRRVVRLPRRRRPPPAAPASTAADLVTSTAAARASAVRRRRGGVGAPELKDWRTLHIHLQSARGLKAMDSNGKSDPYVKLELAGQKHRSKVKQRTLNPSGTSTSSSRGRWASCSPTLCWPTCHDEDLLKDDFSEAPSSTSLALERQAEGELRRQALDAGHRRPPRRLGRHARPGAGRRGGAGLRHHRQRPRHLRAL